MAELSGETGPPALPTTLSTRWGPEQNDGDGIEVTGDQVKRGDYSQRQAIPGGSCYRGGYLPVAIGVTGRSGGGHHGPLGDGTVRRQRGGQE